MGEINKSACWAPLLKEYAFNVKEIDSKCESNDARELVRYYHEEIVSLLVFRKKIKFILIVTELGVPVYVPLYALDFTQKQKDELIARYLLLKTDFDRIVTGF